MAAMDVKGRIDRAAFCIRRRDDVVATGRYAAGENGRESRGDQGFHGSVEKVHGRHIDGGLL